VCLLPDRRGGRSVSGTRDRRVPAADQAICGSGITKVRLTGGEPLLRRGLVELVERLAAMRTFEHEPLDLALTTNGHLLDKLAAPLKAAGLNRVTVSMDAVDAPTFERITRVPGSFEKVLGGIRAAKRGPDTNQDQLRTDARL